MNSIKMVVNTNNSAYDIIIQDDILSLSNNYLKQYEKVMIISDSKVPSIYLTQVKDKLENVFEIIIESGDINKNIENYELILNELVKNNFSRKDCIVGLGGGVVLDLACFVSSTYLRGIDFISFPTTLLAMVDASVGGKCGINYMGYKNIVGSFYNPKHVLIDPLTLNTLNNRLMSEGLAEVIKMSLTSNKDLFYYLKDNDHLDMNYVISEALKIKIDVVTKDYKEKNLRKILNFGHTIGHAIEAISLKSDNTLYHGECVSLGMTYMVSNEIKGELIECLKKYNLPYHNNYNIDDIIEYIKHDKKASYMNNKLVIDIVFVNEIGKCEIRNVSIDELNAMLRR